MLAAAVSGYALLCDRRLVLCLTWCCGWWVFVGGFGVGGIGGGFCRVWI